MTARTVLGFALFDTEPGEAVQIVVAFRPDLDESGVRMHVVRTFPNAIRAIRKGDIVHDDECHPTWVKEVITRWRNGSDQ